MYTLWTFFVPRKQKKVHNIYSAARELSAPLAFDSVLVIAPKLGKCRVRILIFFKGQNLADADAEIFFPKNHLHTELG